MELYAKQLKRSFSTCLYKNRRLHLGEFDLSKDFTGECDGSKYPALLSRGEINESVKEGIYSFESEKGATARFVTPLFPYACYEMTLQSLSGECGFSFIRRHEIAHLLLSAGENGELFVKYVSGDGVCTIAAGKYFSPGIRFSLTVRPGKADVYLDCGSLPVYVTTFDVPMLNDAAKEEIFRDTAVCTYFSGRVKISGASVFMDSGISQADIRPVCFENGEVMTENGKIYLTASVRQQEGAYQGVFSWVPGTCEFELTGALFFDVGDGVWGNEVATDLLFDRRSGKWLLWVCNFSHGHVLARAALDGDVRHGVSVIDVKLTRTLTEDDTDEVFGGKKGDEDPALIYDEQREKWLLAICRVSRVNNSYCYHFFESDSPLENFRYIGKGVPGCETGGSFVRYGEKLHFICGNSFDSRSEYRVYDFDDLSRFELLQFDYPDGGFRGWGSVMPVTRGTRQKLYMLTFDRHRGSEYRWSYGNIYCFSD